MATDWSNDPLVAPETVTPETPGFTTTTAPDDQPSSSTASAAKEQAAQGVDAAKSVAQTAGTEAKHVAQEAGTQTKNLLSEAGSTLKNQAGAQQQKVTEGIRSLSDELSSMTERADEGPARNLVQQAAQRTGSVAGWLEGRDPGSLLNEAISFAQRRPGAFLLVAAAAGVLVGRFTRGATAGGNATASQELAPAPTQPPTVPAVPVGGTTGGAQGGAVWAADTPPADVSAYSDTQQGDPNQPGTGLRP